MARTLRSFVVLSACALCVVPLWGSPAPRVESPAPEAKSPIQSQIFDFVLSGKVDDVKATLASDPSQADLVGPGGMTPLGIALSRRNLALVQALLDGGADPNKPFGPLQMHPIQGAAASGNLDAVKALLAKKADPNGKDVNGGTALHAATLYKNVDIARLLADRDGDVNAAFAAGPNLGATPLHFAARSKSIDLVMAVTVARSDWSLKWNERTPA